MDRKKGVAYCGLACCLCSENASCPGCRNGGCEEKTWCKSFTCCREKGLSGCWACPDFPCENPMLNKPRVRTFAAFIREHGEAELMDLLERNEAAGLLYHYEGQLVGDYDRPATGEGILHLLLTGRQTPEADV
ncbi:MAG TPA: DUF3795 domain-containing protein [Oscillospiraceae bacterium]|nr:DUF3795 domain-containing protein [Oscillospiraceae bacterium]